MTKIINVEGSSDNEDNGAYDSTGMLSLSNSMSLFSLVGCRK